MPRVSLYCQNPKKNSNAFYLSASREEAKREKQTAEAVEIRKSERKQSHGARKQSVSKKKNERA